MLKENEYSFFVNNKLPLFQNGKNLLRSDRPVKVKTLWHFVSSIGVQFW